ncbi:unnamed protein product [Prunus armeniaca]
MTWFWCFAPCQGKPRVRGRRTCEARQGQKTCVLGWSWQPRHGSKAAQRARETCAAGKATRQRSARQTCAAQRASKGQRMSTDRGQRAWAVVWVGAWAVWLAVGAHGAGSSCRQMVRTMLAGCASSWLAGCATQAGRLCWTWLNVAVWLKTCWSGSRTWAKRF